MQTTVSFNQQDQQMFKELLNAGLTVETFSFFVRSAYYERIAKIRGKTEVNLDGRLNTCNNREAYVPADEKRNDAGAE